MKKVNEIFYSLQGEGHHTGVPSVFIRFSGCNLQCPFCDTKHEEGRMMDEMEIVAEVRRYPGEWIILTGGEPTLQADDDFVNLLHITTGKKVAIETNGTRYVPANIDWITVSPKNGLAGAGAAQKTDQLGCADEIKVVDCGQDLEQFFKSPWRGEDTKMYLQPCFVEDEEEFEANRMRTVQRILEDPRWRLSLQTHRYLKIR